MKKIIPLLSAIIVFGVAAFIISYYFKEKKLEPIRTSGIVQGTEINLMAKIAGRISEICCNEGNSIKKGSIAIRLESDDLKAAVEQAAASVEKAKADVKSAEALIESSKAELNTAEADVEKARVQMEEAKRQMERMTSLFKENLVSEADRDRAVTSFESLKASYEASKAIYNAMLSRKELAESQLNHSRSQLISTKARVKESETGLSFQRAKLNDTVIASPISGTIAFTAFENGEFVSPGAAILTIVDMDNLWVRVDLEETIVGHISLESEVFVTVDALPEKVVKGKISEIGRYAEFATQRDVKHGRQDIKTFHVKINIEDPGKILKPGMTVNVEMPRRYPRQFISGETEEPPHCCSKSGFRHIFSPPD